MRSSQISEGVNTVQASSAQEWRNWLSQNHDQASGIWLIIHRKESEIPSVYYPEAVDEALCFGWVDSAPGKRNAQSYYQYFVRRNPKSNWSQLNKDKVVKLTEAGKMAQAGQLMVALDLECQTASHSKKRLEETVRLAAQNIKANHPQ